ncbi:hypothetical protein [Kibdelosporangium philippinense]|uniref:hypothetical protein n=1 Tax=Kibdelosporangium philippinense TaxID=211113 RepID=UPI00361A1597
MKNKDFVAAPQISGGGLGQCAQCDHLRNPATDDNLTGTKVLQACSGLALGIG